LTPAIHALIAVAGLAIGRRGGSLVSDDVGNVIGRVRAAP
jgi:hypothetical protein